MRDFSGHDWDKMRDQCRLCGMTGAIALDYKASDIGMSCADYKEEQEADDANDPKDAYPCFCGRASCEAELKKRASAKDPHQYTPDCELCRRDFPKGEGWMPGYDVLHVSPIEKLGCDCNMGIHCANPCHCGWSDATGEESAFKPQILTVFNPEDPNRFAAAFLMMPPLADIYDVSEMD